MIKHQGGQLFTAFDIMRSADWQPPAYITEETDPTVPSWAKTPQKPTYTAAEVGAMPKTTFIPSKISDLSNDSGYLTAETDPTVSIWAKQPQKPTYTSEEVGALSLDDVEYGKFTPVLKCTTTDPTYTVGYALGYYERIGKVVNINLVMSVTITNAGSGLADIGGLPFVNGFNTPWGFTMIRASGVLNVSNPAGAFVLSGSDRIRLTYGDLIQNNSYKVGNGYIGISTSYRI